MDLISRSLLVLIMYVGREANKLRTLFFFAMDL